ncbi:MAG: hypothetical protein GY717_08605, partial [Rhodobacteraceae bacterium]|nr:hypothetical protein [Paracoccaceae bacterium]
AQHVIRCAQDCRKAGFDHDDAHVSQLLDHRTATVNALRGHLAEFGLIAPVGLKNVERLRALVAHHEALPNLVVEMTKLHFERIDALSEEIDTLTARIKERMDVD